MAKKFILDKDAFTESDGGSIYKGENTYIYDAIDGMTESNIMIMGLEDDVVFPYLNVQIELTDAKNIACAKKAFKTQEPVFFFYSGDILLLDEPEELIFSRGPVGLIKDYNETPDGKAYVMINLETRAILMNVRRRSPYMRADIVYTVPDQIEDTAEERNKGIKLEALYEDISHHLSEEDRQQLMKMWNSIPKDTVRRFYFMVQNSPLSNEDRYRILEAHTLQDQRDLLIDILEEKQEELAVRAQIHNKTMAEMGQRQKEEFLRTQLQQIKNELGEGEDSDIEELRSRAMLKEWNEDTMQRFNKELRKLQRYNPTSVDYAIQYSYLDTYLKLPWQHCDNAEISLDEVEATLERDHYGLEKVKERIVEQMAVLKLRKDTKAPILCLYGPPGVGKTSLGKSVADALGRKYVRVALGGLHDEAEIRGHRRTYIGAMPGRIITALEKCGTSDPVMVLDEIDKIGADYKGDPSQALLEVLDPEQNCKFHDNYVDQDYDLSKVLFIATANSLSTISAPLLDRMEIIEIGGYVEAEKIQIAQRHLISKNLLEHGFKAKEVKFTDEALSEIIGSYTRESGVRRLEKKINEILRKLARLKASGKKFPKTINAELVKEYLGKPEAFSDVYENNDIPGIVTGLAWTQAGGEILFIESSTAPGKEGKLVLTGNLGDVMKESAMLALQYIKANHDKLGIAESALEVGTVHIHVPEGAVPKDGPSAGVTIVTSLASTFTGRKVRPRLAMTGEITLRGKVLPVGGIKEKILAAKRAGIDTVMLCEKNRKDIEEIKAEYLEGLTFHYVETVDEVLDFALL